MTTTVLQGAEAEALRQTLDADAAAVRARLRAAGAKSFESVVDTDPPTSDVDEP